MTKNADDGSLAPEHLDDAPPESGPKKTERGRERDREEHDFHSVIVKRVDMARRHADDILEHAIEDGLEQLKRRRRSLFLSAIAGGVMVSFSVMAVAVMALATSAMETPVQRLAMALVYPLGFIICITASTELFTEHTATAVYPVLDRRAKPPALLSLWAVVLVGNLVGALGGAALLALADTVVQARQGYITIASHIVEPATGALFASATVAGVLMALGGWLTYATQPGIAQILVIYVVTFLIGVGGLHHSIAGSAEIFVGLMLGSGHGLGISLWTIAVAAVGNLVGGTCVVAILNYGHIRESQTIAS